ncbi:MAG: ParB/RepB/Spo0J family partition protein [Nitrososphaerota archaeon]|nr:ParB/RepB/Spo0J family partition protein [Nitrososphaerota archaeon]MDG7026504.1 ParB/RepB/Spo0J family partition protein [Nitrososphaerota archaeon]
MVTRLNDYLNAISVFERLEIGLISFSPNPIRQYKDDLSDLTASIQEHGLLEPIIVRPKGNGFEVVAGNRRLKACRLLRFRRVNCVVSNLDDADAFEVSLIENVQRRTLNPLEEAEAFKKYCKEFGWGSQTQLAKKLGKSQEYISHRLKLLELPEEAKQELLSGRLSPTAAQELVWLKSDDRCIAALGFLKETELNTKSVRRLVRDLNAEESSRIGTGFEVSPDEFSGSHGKNFIEEAVLIMRISLARLDLLVTKVSDAQLKTVLLTKKSALNSILDDLIQMKMSKIYQPRSAPAIALRAG